MKSDEIKRRYGAPDSVRVDVYEHGRDGTICVYDMKTGTQPLRVERMQEISDRALHHFKDARRTFITEVTVPRMTPTTPYARAKLKRTYHARIFAPLLARHPDLVAVNDWLFVKPVRHIARFGILAPTASYDTYVPRWAASEVFRVDPRYLGLQHGERIAKAPHNVWHYPDEMADPHFHDAFESALPRLRAVETIEDFDALLTAPDFHGKRTIGGLEKPMMFDIVYGRFGNARSYIERVIERQKVWDDLREQAKSIAKLRRLKEKTLALKHGYSDLYLCREDNVQFVRDLYPLLVAEDRRAIGDLLRSWERATCASHKVEHIWEPSPFPMEIEVGITSVEPPR